MVLQVGINGNDSDRVIDGNKAASRIGDKNRWWSVIDRDTHVDHKDVSDILQ